VPFIQAVDPRVVIVSRTAGSTARRFLPDASTLQRYCDHSPAIRIYRTDENDAAENRTRLNDADGDTSSVRTNGTALHVDPIFRGPSFTPHYLYVQLTAEVFMSSLEPFIKPPHPAHRLEHRCGAATNFFKLRNPALRDAARPGAERGQTREVREHGITVRSLLIGIALAVLVKANLFEILSSIESPWTRWAGSNKSTTSGRRRPLPRP